jgi:hypothetical protein
MSLDTPHLSYSWRDNSADEGAGIDGKVEHREECLKLSILLWKLELVPYAIHTQIAELHANWPKIGSINQKRGRFQIKT